MLRPPPRCILPKQLLCGPICPQKNLHLSSCNKLNKKPTSGLQVSSALSHGLVAPSVLNGQASLCVHGKNTALPPSDAQKSTIYALSTPAGKAGVGVIRISGPDALKQVWGRMVQPHSRSLLKGKLGEPAPWRLQRCRIVHPETKEMIDDGLLAYFKGPKSFTSEDVVELHVHSGRAVISATLSALSKLPTFRPAEPGEFTRRAYLNGRLDLTQVEGLKDLIDAETEGQRRVAVRAAEGVTKQKLDELRAGIISSLAKVEALIDFGEGEEIEEGVYEEARSRVQKVLHTIQGYLNDHRRGELLRSGIRLAIFGPPNAGKSSLLNFLAQREAAIVTPIPGTTRDILELSLDIGGLPVVIADTAGLRKTEDLVEKIGIERATNAVESADISICVLSLPEVMQQLQGDSDSTASSHWRELISRENTYFLFNKSDLVGSGLTPSPSAPLDAETLRRSLLPPAPQFEGSIGNDSLDMDVLSSTTPTNAWKASLATGEGAEEFLQSFAEALKKRFGMDDILSDAASPVITRSRHRDHLQSAKRHLEMFLEYGPDDVVFAAEELRYAANAIGKVTGAIGVEDILDAVFRDFCIGK